MFFEYRGVQVNHPEEMSQEEATAYVDNQLQFMPNRPLQALDLSIEGNEVLLRPHYNTINRVRRITGYLSTIKNFNDAKKAEAHDRVKHVFN